MAYADVYARSLDDPEGFWRDAAEAIDWDVFPSVILDDSTPPFYRWFPDGRMNTCFNALDRHVAAGRGEQSALIYDSPVTGQVRAYSYAELTHEVAVLAGALRSLGVEQGLDGDAVGDGDQQRSFPATTVLRVHGVLVGRAGQADVGSGRPYESHRTSMIVFPICTVSPLVTPVGAVILRPST